MNSVVGIRRSVFSLEKQELVLSILKSAFPIFVMLESVAMIGAVDLEIAGRISAAAQAAVGLGDQLLYLTSTAASGLSVATCAVGARYFGAGNLKRMSLTIQASIIVATISGITAMIVGWLLADDFVRLLSGDADVISNGARYIRLCSIGSLPYVLSIVISSVFRAIGRTAESLYSSITTAALAIGLSYFLFAIGPWKGSLEALCLAWDIAAYLGLGISLILLKKHLNYFVSHGTQSKINKGRERKNSLRLVKLLFLIGAAIVLAESSTLATDFLVYKLLSMLDGATNLQAAWTIFLKVEETFAIMPISALSLAFATTVGQMIGQGKEKQARDCLQFLIVSTAIFSAVIGTALVAAPHVMALFTHADTQVFINAKEMLSFLPVLFPLLAIRLLAFSYMEGAGQTAIPMKLSLTGNAIKLSLGALLMNILSFGSPGLVFSILIARTFTAVYSILALRATARIKNSGN